jgi:hypothetical protein
VVSGSHGLRPPGHWYCALGFAPFVNVCLNILSLIFSSVALRPAISNPRNPTKGLKRINNSEFSSDLQEAFEVLAEKIVINISFSTHVLSTLFSSTV